MVELLIVFMLLGVLSAITFPRIASMRASAALRAARIQFTASLATARAAAVRFGRPAQLKRVGNRIQVWADTGGTGTFVSLGPPVALDAAFKVTLGASVDSIVFGPRGLATSLPTSGARFALVRADIRDSICLTRLGEMSARGCR